MRKMPMKIGNHMENGKVICPDCGAEMKLRETKKFLTKDGKPRKFYGCTRWPECNATHGAHPNGRPLGIPCDKETKAWRHKAHELFDKLWKEYGYSKGESYDLLCTIMGMSHKDAHIANFNTQQCQLLINKLEAYARQTQGTQAQSA